MSRRWIALGALAAALSIAWLLRRASTVERSAPPADAGRAAASAADAAPAKKSTIVLFPDGGAPASSRVFVRGAWGSAPGEFGHRLDPESAPEGPMSLTVDAAGNLLVLDQLNHRVQRFGRDGRRLASIPIGGDTAQDLAATRDGRLLVLDRLGEQNVQLLDGDGHPLGEAALRGPKLPDPGGVTGLYTDADGDAYAEREHGELVRVADADGRASIDRPTLPGRPRRDGKLYLRGAIADRAAGTFTVRALDAESQPAWEATVPFGAPILYVALLDSDASGAVYTAAHVGHESARPPYPIVDERVELRSLDADGRPRGALTLDAAPAPEEVFREFSVGDDGTVYRMRRTPDGIVIEAYRF